MIGKIHIMRCENIENVKSSNSLILKFCVCGESPDPPPAAPYRLLHAPRRSVPAKGSPLYALLTKCIRHTIPHCIHIIACMKIANIKNIKSANSPISKLCIHTGSRPIRPPHHPTASYTSRVGQFLRRNRCAPSIRHGMAQCKRA